MNSVDACRMIRRRATGLGITSALPAMPCAPQASPPTSKPAELSKTRMQLARPGLRNSRRPLHICFVPIAPEVHWLQRGSLNAPDEQLQRIFGVARDFDAIRE
jgi:hypothetical protein